MRRGLALLARGRQWPRLSNFKYRDSRTRSFTAIRREKPISREGKAAIERSFVRTLPPNGVWSIRPFRLESQLRKVLRAREPIRQRYNVVGQRPFCPQEVRRFRWPHQGIIFCINGSACASCSIKFNCRVLRRNDYTAQPFRIRDRFVIFFIVDFRTSLSILNNVVRRNITSSRVY